MKTGNALGRGAGNIKQFLIMKTENALGRGAMPLRRTCGKGQLHVHMALILLLEFSLDGLATAPAEVTIGAIVQDASAENRQVHLALQVAVDYINQLPNILPDTKLVLLKNSSSSMSTVFEDIQNACYMAKEGVSTVIGPTYSNSVKSTYPILSSSHIPQIAPFATDPSFTRGSSDYDFLLRMSSPDDLQAKAIVDLALHFGWSRFAIIAERTECGRNGIQEFQSIAAAKDWKISNVEYFEPTENATEIDFTPHLLNIKKKGARIILMDCIAPFARAILDQAFRLNMLDKKWAWIVTDDITAINGLFRFCNDVPAYLNGLLGTRPAYGKGALYPTFLRLWKNYTRNLEPEPSPSEGNAMRFFDSVLVFAHGLHNYLRDGYNLTEYQQTESICVVKDPPVWVDGQRLLQYMKEVDIDGVMNRLNFGQDGGTSVTTFEVVNLVNDVWSVVGGWNNSNNGTLFIDENALLVFPGRTSNIPSDTTEDLTNITIRIVTIIEEPFMVRKTPDEIAKDPNGPRYKGMCVDLLQQLQSILNFKYEIYVVEDGNYGSVNDTTQTWNGLFGDLVTGKADVALGPLSITYERQQYVDFTKPYMDLGLLILMPKKTQSSGLVSFLEPFERDLWIAIVVAFMVVSIATALCSFCSPYGFAGRYIQRLDKDSEKYKEGRNAFNFFNSLWNTYACWMNQGAETAPRALSGRFVYGIWWFAVMVIAATYTANLAAFLTVARLDTGISSVEDLADQNDILYGTVANTAVQKFFQTQDSYPYSKMARFMEMEDTYVSTVTEGIARVRAVNNQSLPGNKREFAFIYDSTVLEYETQKAPCETITVGTLFNAVGYGIALQKNSPYTQAFSLQILKLRQDGTLERMKNTHIDSGSCNGATDENAVTTKEEQATLRNMMGIFYFIALGIILGIIILMFECCTASLKESLTKREGRNVSCCSAMGRRLRAVSRECSKAYCSCCDKPSHDIDNVSINGHTGPYTESVNSTYNHGKTCLTNL